MGIACCELSQERYRPKRQKTGHEVSYGYGRDGGAAAEKAKSDDVDFEYIIVAMTA